MRDVYKCEQLKEGWFISFGFCLVIQARLHEWRAPTNGARLKTSSVKDERKGARDLMISLRILQIRHKCRGWSQARHHSREDVAFLRKRIRQYKMREMKILLGDGDEINDRALMAVDEIVSHSFRLSSGYLWHGTFAVSALGYWKLQVNWSINCTYHHTI